MLLDVGWQVLDPHAEGHLLAAFGVEWTWTLAEVVYDLLGQC